MSDSRFVELHDAPKADSYGTATRSFIVPASTEVAAINYNQVDPAFPRYGDEHPRLPGTFLNAIRIVDRPNGEVFTVQCEYATPGGFSGGQPHIDPTAAGVSLESGSTSARTVQVPYFQYIKQSVPPPPGFVGPSNPDSFTVTVPRLLYVQPPIPIRQFSYTRTVNVESLTWGQVKAVRAQYNRVHIIGGDKFLFTSFTFSQERIGSYNLVYEWLSEEPTDIATVFGLLPTSNQYIFPPAVLPPFHGFLLTKTPGPLPPVDEIQTAPLFNESTPTGYSTFPGNPIGGTQ